MSVKLVELHCISLSSRSYLSGDQFLIRIIVNALYGLLFVALFMIFGSLKPSFFIYFVAINSVNRFEQCIHLVRLI
jgi:hypothetical protein